MELKEVILKGLNRSVSMDQYTKLMEDLSAHGGTTGDQKEDFIYYTKLNAQRSRRITKTVHLDQSTIDQVERIDQPQTWLVITESWCGDAANSIPVVAKMAGVNSKIDLRLVLRDEDTSLIDHFHTKGSRSIPKLVALNENRDVLFTWGPRPETAQELYDEWRNDPNKVPYKEFQVTLQQWYNKNRGQDLQKEVIDLLSRSIALETNSF